MWEFTDISVRLFISFLNCKNVTSKSVYKLSQNDIIAPTKTFAVVMSKIIFLLLLQ